jgi:predicted transcriptional regulator
MRNTKIMSKPQFRKTERCEDTGTARIVHGTKSAVAAGREILLPKTVVDRLAAGENPIRVLREWRDKTQMYITFRTDISQGHLSDIENGRRIGTPAALRKIADVLKVPLDLLIR